MSFDWIGWLATAVFASSYLTRRTVTLRRIQGTAALMWAVYGGLIHALPVLVANLIVAAMAIGSSFMRPAAPVVPQP
jgi:hypothetical protein